MMNQRLVTVDRLAQWRIEVEKTCVLCKTDEETAEHLFINCKFCKKNMGETVKLDREAN